MSESTIWTEKYRPQKFEEVKGQKEIVEKIKAFVESGSMPHLLFSGPAGIGKCVTGETPIMVGDGRVKSIKECFDEKIKTVMTLGLSGEISSGKVAYFYKEKAESTFRIETTSGKFIRVTPEHPFLVLKEGIPTWTEANKIARHDLLASPLKVSPKFKNHHVNWSNKSCFWAKLRNEVSCEPSSLFLGVKKKVLKCLESLGEGEYITNKEIGRLTSEKKGVVEWATRELEHERIVISSGKNPKNYSLKNHFILTDELPLNLVKDKKLIKKLFWRSKLRQSSTRITFFEKTTSKTKLYKEFVSMLR